MANMIRKSFLLLFSAFLFYIFSKLSYRLNADFGSLSIFILIMTAVIAAAIWIALQLDKRLAARRFHILIKAIVNSLILLFFIYQLFTPYFYTDKYLQNAGLEQIETYYQLSNKELTDQERSRMAESSLVEDMAFATLSTNHDPKQRFIDVKPMDLQRSYYHYDMIVEWKQKNAQTNVYQYTFAREKGKFKIKGITQLEAEE
ncbi:hypothetical protein GWK91_01960 [Virgibacillus sp. MSP4-1]|uniref:hypothetical protein n=1 Tax=Virgibacillus sp. MSP4-1 TaxID=2700081 RepID=UPI0005C643E0|nr:hypothetical protein [Virgibacillus sp. MSP4-1]QHS21782.1 hypothetical protein GWK91_01960 [Virgibacillus sp. MSP4-1]